MFCANALPPSTEHVLQGDVASHSFVMITGFFASSVQYDMHDTTSPNCCTCWASKLTSVIICTALTTRPPLTDLTPAEQEWRQSGQTADCARRCQCLAEYENVASPMQQHIRSHFLNQQSMGCQCNADNGCIFHAPWHEHIRTLACALCYRASARERQRKRSRGRREHPGG